MTTLDSLRELLVKKFGLEQARLEAGAELTSLGLDSLDMLEMMFEIEDRFQLKIKDDIPTTLSTLNDVVQYIDGLIARNLATPADSRHKLPTAR